MRQATISEINQYSPKEYGSHLEPLYEYSPWIVEKSISLLPFDTLGSMQAGFESIIFSASEQQKLNLLQSHPDLAAKIEEISSLTEFSKAEQAKAGFASLPPSALSELRVLLVRYREQFGHPYILCVSDYDASEALPILKARISNSKETEQTICLAQVTRIGWHRLQQLVTD